jgi:hypothetical protein
MLGEEEWDLVGYMRLPCHRGDFFRAQSSLETDGSHPASRERASRDGIWIFGCCFMLITEWMGRQHRCIPGLSARGSCFHAPPLGDEDHDKLCSPPVEVAAINDRSLLAFTPIADVFPLEPFPAPVS